MRFYAHCRPCNQTKVFDSAYERDSWVVDHRFLMQQADDEHVHEAAAYEQ